MKLFTILLASIFVNNFILVKFYGICPFLGVSKKVSTAFGMGMAVTFVMALASAITYFVQVYLLDAFDLGYLQTIAFILVIAVLVQLVEMFIQKSSPALYQSLGIYLPLITTNCAVLGAAILNITSGYNLLQTLVNGVATGLSFTFAIVLFAGVRERMELAPIPKCMEGFPIALVSAALMAMAFLGFSGLVSL